jgi:ElaB/YqjD/DUF883 family membrane-anchored ribosome-binding protein
MSIRIEEEGTDTPQTVDEARDAVQRSRQRISSTLDALEERIVEKKHEIQDRADVMRPVREQIAGRPFTAVFAGLALGAFLGSLGGRDEEEHVHRRSGRLSGQELGEGDREELRQWRRERKQRLRARMRRQRGGRPGELRAHREDFRDDKGDDSRFDALKHQLLGALTSAVTAAVTTRLRRMAMDGVGGIMDNVMGSEEREGGRGRERGSWSDEDLSRHSGRRPATEGSRGERESYP